jgi:peptidoglycan/LPS O-acetylase OafA/YrhL
MSYPIYIFHEPVLLVIDNELHWGQHHTLGLYAHFIAIFAAILVTAALVTFLYDQPVQRGLRQLTRRVTGRKNQKALPPAPALS